MKHRKNYRLIGPGNPEGAYYATLLGAKRALKRAAQQGEIFLQESYGENNWQTVAWIDGTSPDVPAA